MPSPRCLPTGRVLTADNWLKTLRAIYRSIRQDNKIMYEYTWQYYLSVLLSFLVDVQSGPGGFYFTTAQQFVFEREVIKKGRHPDPEECDLWSTDVHPGSEPRPLPTDNTLSFEDSDIDSFEELLQGSGPRAIGKIPALQFDEPFGLDDEPVASSTPRLGSPLPPAEFSLEDFHLDHSDNGGRTSDTTDAESPHLDDNHPLTTNADIPPPKLPDAGGRFYNPFSVSPVATTAVLRERQAEESTKPATTEVPKQDNIGTEWRIPDICVFLARKDEEEIHRPFGSFELKPAAGEKEVEIAMNKAFLQAVLQARFIFENGRDIYQWIYVVVFVGEKCAYGRATADDLKAIPLPEGPIENPKKYQEDQEQLVVRCPTFNIWLDDGRTEFTPEFENMYTNMFDEVRAEH